MAIAKEMIVRSFIGVSISPKQSLFGIVHTRAL